MNDDWGSPVRITPRESTRKLAGVARIPQMRRQNPSVRRSDPLSAAPDGPTGPGPVQPRSPDRCQAALAGTSAAVRSGPTRAGPTAAESGTARVTGQACPPSEKPCPGAPPPSGAGAFGPTPASVSAKGRPAPVSVANGASATTCRARPKRRSCPATGPGPAAAPARTKPAHARLISPVPKIPVAPARSALKPASATVNDT